MSDDFHRERSERFVHLLPELSRRIAGSYLGSRGPGHTLSPTALVNEAYCAFITRNVPIGKTEEESRFILAWPIWRVMVDRFRANGRKKNGGHLRRTTSVIDVGETPRATVTREMDIALENVRSARPMQARPREMKLLAGMTSREIGEVLGISASTPVTTADWHAILCVFPIPGNRTTTSRTRGPFVATPRDLDDALPDPLEEAFFALIRLPVPERTHFSKPARRSTRSD
ncbi:MAG: ECF-type sigma factor [Candidatus Eisenbacteria bacterium]